MLYYPTDERDAARASIRLEPSGKASIRTREAIHLSESNRTLSLSL